MPGHDLRRAVIPAPLILLLISTVTLAQDSSSTSASDPTGSASTTAAQDPQASTSSEAAKSRALQSAEHRAPAQTAVNAKQHWREQDPELAAILQAERDGRLVEEEKLLNAAIQKAETKPGLERRLSLLLEHLASLKMRQGKAEEAVALAERAIEISKAVYGPNSPNVARQLNNLAMFRPRAPNGAEDLKVEHDYQEALKIARLNPGQRNNVLLMVVNNFAEYYLRHGRAADAEALINEALQNCQHDPAPKPMQCASFRNLLAQAYRQEGHPNAAEGVTLDAAAADLSSNRSWHDKLRNLEVLAQQYEEDGVYDLAESNYRQALALIEQNSKPNEPTESPEVMNRLGLMLQREGRNEEAEELFKRALEIEKTEMQSQPPRMTGWLTYYVFEGLYRSEGRLAEFEPIVKQAIEVYERVQSPNKEPLAEAILDLARVYHEEGRSSDAEPLCERALKIQEANYGPESTQLSRAIGLCSEVARQLGETDKANALENRLKQIREKSTPPE